MDHKAHLADLHHPGFTLCGVPSATRTLADVATAHRASSGRLAVFLCDGNGKEHSKVCRGCCDGWQRSQLQAVAALLTAPLQERA